MVAEENGFIHIYDLKSGQDILSCRTEIQNGRPTSPLLDAHWHPADFTKVLCEFHTQAYPLGRSSRWE